jgi:nitrate reductase NapE component
MHDDATVCPSCNAEYGVKCHNGSIRSKENCVRQTRNIFLLVFLAFVAAVSIGFVQHNCIPCWMIAFMTGPAASWGFVLWMFQLMKKEGWWH